MFHLHLDDPNLAEIKCFLPFRTSKCDLYQGLICLEEKVSRWLTWFLHSLGKGPFSIGVAGNLFSHWRSLQMVCSIVWVRGVTKSHQIELVCIEKLNFVCYICFCPPFHIYPRSVDICLLCYVIISVIANMSHNFII